MDCVIRRRSITKAFLARPDNIEVLEVQPLSILDSGWYCGRQGQASPLFTLRQKRYYLSEDPHDTQDSRDGIRLSSPSPADLLVIEGTSKKTTATGYLVLIER